MTASVGKLLLQVRLCGPKKIVTTHPVCTLLRFPGSASVKLCLPDSPEDLHTAADPRKHAGGTTAEQHLAPGGAMTETAKRGSISKMWCANQFTLSSYRGLWDATFLGLK